MGKWAITITSLLILLILGLVLQVWGIKVTMIDNSNHTDQVWMLIDIILFQPQGY